MALGVLLRIFAAVLAVAMVFSGSRLIPPKVNIIVVENVYDGEPFIMEATDEDVILSTEVPGIPIFRNIQAKTGQNAPVPDVTKQLWDSGVEIMQARMGDDYREQMLATASYDHLRVSMTNDLDGLGALLPSDRQLNDQLFIDALKQIQVNINMRLEFDWKMKYDRASLSGDMTASQMEVRSAQGWQDVKDQFQALVDAKSKGELERVRNWDVKIDSVKIAQEPTPTPRPQEQSYRSLAVGSSGDEVKTLQDRLIELGYLASGQADGKFGSKTKTAVQLFQQTVGLVASGIADEATQRELFSNDAPMRSN